MRSNLSPSLGKIFSVEWNQSVTAVQSRLLPAAAHFVLPDLPEIFSDQDRIDFSSGVDPNQRIHTIATCHHENSESLLHCVSNVDPDSKILLVGGNNRGRNSLSSVDAARILRNEKGNILWGVTNPNDPKSVDSFEEKVESGMSGFLTQPLLSSHGTNTMEIYRDCTNAEDATILAGLAFPKTIRGLRFWAKLLGQEDLEKDPLFQSHLAYFSQPYVTPIAWTGRELQDLLVNPSVDGAHFMPLSNIDDLCNIFKSLNNIHRSTSGNE
mmetsp:Transcript_7568/g.14968  ORF Transcript_7568/g.14968 Transcript_7568/m.14968 type:complete len:268 (-) Transcript_7568:1086-1889(-)